MEYTSGQKQKLYKELLPHIFMEGGTLFVDSETYHVSDRFDADYKPYKDMDLYISVDLLDPKNDTQLNALLYRYLTRSSRPPIEFFYDNIIKHRYDSQRPEVRDIQQQVTKIKEELRSKAKLLAAEYDHENPYELPKDIEVRRKHVAKTLAYNCPEEAELLYYHHLKYPESWPLLVHDNTISKDDGTKAGGIMHTAGAIHLCESAPPIAAYEEMTHFADYVLGKEYMLEALGHLPDKKSIFGVKNPYVFFSQYALADDHIKTIFDKYHDYYSALENAPTSIFRKNQRRLRKVLAAKERDIPDEKLGTLQVSFSGFSGRKNKKILEKLEHADDMIAAIQGDTELKTNYDEVRRKFFEKNDTSGAATEIMAKTYSNLLSCRDQIESVGPKSSFNLGSFIKYLASVLPQQGKIAFFYQHTRDEYLNSLRKELGKEAIASPEYEATGYWRDQIMDINQRNNSRQR